MHKEGINLVNQSHKESASDWQSPLYRLAQLKNEMAKGIRIKPLKGDSMGEVLGT